MATRPSIGEEVHDGSATDSRLQPSHRWRSDPGELQARDPGTVLDVGSVVVVGDDDWGVVQAEVVEHYLTSGSLVLRLLGELVDERTSELSHPA